MEKEIHPSCTEIRPFSPDDDKTALSRVYEESWKFAYRGIIPQSYLDSIPPGRWASAADRPGMRSLVLLDGNTMAGTSSVCASRFPEMSGFGEIVSIYLLPEYIGKGYGKPLLEAAKKALFEMGFSDLFLWVLEENERARRFYERNGFVLTDSAIETEIGGKKLREIRYIFRA